MGVVDEYFAFTVAREIAGRGGGSFVVTQERAHLGEKRFPGRLGFLKDVVVALERHEASVR
jgi:hypothetical protein